MLRTLASRCGSASRRFLASRVVNVGSVEAYDKLSTTGDLLVTNFTASWCGPCQAAAPVFDKMPPLHLAWVPNETPDPYPHDRSALLPLYLDPERETQLGELRLPCSGTEAAWLQAGAAMFLSGGEM